MAYRFRYPYTQYHVRAFIGVHCTTLVFRFYNACDRLNIPLGFPRDRDNLWDNADQAVEYAATQNQLEEFVRVLLEELNRPL